MKKKIILNSLLVGVLFLAAGCAKIPKLQDGKEVLAEIDGYKMSVEDLYAELKERGGLTVALDLIDKQIIDKEITDKTGAESYADSQVEMYKQYYGDSFEDTLKQYGYSSVETFKELIKSDYLKQKVAQNYIKTTITDDEINNYYEENIYGDQTVRYILIKPVEAESDATDEEKLELETEALKEANEIIKKINDGEKFEDLAKEYSDDKLSALNGGLMSNFNSEQVNKTFFDAVIALKDGEMTKEPVKDELGYNIILKVSAKAKPELKDVKDDIVETISEQKMKSEENAITKAWVQIRKNYKLNIIDTDIKTLYQANYE